MRPKDGLPVMPTQLLFSGTRVLYRPPLTYMRLPTLTR